MQVEHHTVRPGTGDVDVDNRDAAQRVRRGDDVAGQGLGGQHLLEQGALERYLSPQVEGGIAEDLLDRLALLKAHRRAPGAGKKCASCARTATGTVRPRVETAADRSHASNE